MMTTVARLGTRAECQAALDSVASLGAWDGRKIVRGRLVGEPRWDRRSGEWHVEQDFVPEPNPE